MLGSSHSGTEPAVTDQIATDALTKVVFWPSPQDYCEALQCPQESLSCPDLKAGEPELDNLGLPRPISGAFASVYKVVTASAERAVRCFLLKREDQYERYRLISAHLNSNPLPYTVDFDYLAEGIKVANSWFPIVDMDWVQGETLDQYLRTHYRDTAIVKEICNEFVKMMAALRRACIAHGDLQHGNILVMPDRTLKLVDYDGMFVPSMSGMQSCELGHRNYQHPKRTSAHFDANLDNFSALTIFVTLKAIEADPRLVERLDALNECSLFRAGDFNDPLASKAFHLLERHKNEELGKLSRLIRQYLDTDPCAVPALADLPSEPDEYIFSLSTISADLLSPDFLDADAADENSLAEVIQEAKAATEEQDNAEREKTSQVPHRAPLYAREGPVQSKTGTASLPENLFGAFVCVFFFTWFTMLGSFIFSSFLPADRSQLPAEFQEVFTTPFASVKVIDYSHPKRKGPEFTVESEKPLAIRCEARYRRKEVNGVANLPWVRTALFRERTGGNISILLDSKGIKAHVDIANQNLFAVTRDGINIQKVMKLGSPSYAIAVDGGAGDQVFRDEESRGLTVNHAGVSLCKLIDPTALTPAAFEAEIRSYIRQLQLAPVDPAVYVGPAWNLTLVIPDRTLSNEQIKVLERISEELKAAAPDKVRPTEHEHHIWLQVILPVKIEY